MHIPGISQANLKQISRKSQDISGKLARVCGFPVSHRFGGQLATTLVATKNDIIFFFKVPKFQAALLEVDFVFLPSQETTGCPIEPYPLCVRLITS